MTAITLKPCPFCGGTAEHTVWGLDKYNRVGCSRCDIEFDHFLRAEDAAEAWNNRAPEVET